MASTARALALHRGPFLPDFRYDDWAAFEIARQHDLYLDLLEEAAGLESMRGNYMRAADLLRLAIAVDPLRESSYVELMQTHWMQGRRTDALRVYQACARYLPNGSTWSRSSRQSAWPRRSARIGRWPADHPAPSFPVEVIPSHVRSASGP